MPRTSLQMKPRGKLCRACQKNGYAKINDFHQIACLKVPHTGTQLSRDILESPNPGLTDVTDALSFNNVRNENGQESDFLTIFFHAHFNVPIFLIRSASLA